MSGALRRIRFHAGFRVDLRSHLSWLREHRDPAWIERLRTEIDEATSLLTSFPDMGALEGEDGAVILRKLLFSKLPYLIWYARDTRDPRGDIWILRLFHARQDRPTVTLPALPPRRRGEPST
jgi:plasmid stabilization system protein ParE